jgi:hypothetical protein
MKYIDTDELERIMGQRGVRILAGKEERQPDGSVHTPIQVRRRGWRHVDMVVVTPPEEEAPKGWDKVEGGVQAA